MKMFQSLLRNFHGSMPSKATTFKIVTCDASYHSRIKKPGTVGIIVRNMQGIFLDGISYLVTEEDAAKDKVKLTSGYVETKGLILSARYCVEKGYDSVRLFTDYETIISTLYPKDPTRYHQGNPFVSELKEIVQPFPYAEYLWIRKLDNKPAHEVATGRYEVQTEKKRIVKLSDPDVGDLKRKYASDLQTFDKFLKDESFYRKWCWKSWVDGIGVRKAF